MYLPVPIQDYVYSKHIQNENYPFQLIYKESKHMHLADTLCRAPLEMTEQHSDEEASFEVMPVQHISSSRLDKLRDHTTRDKDLQALCKIIQSGWPKCDVNLPASVRRYFTFGDELAIEDGIIMKGPKAVHSHYNVSTSQFCTEVTLAQTPRHAEQEALCSGSLCPRT